MIYLDSAATTFQKPPERFLMRCRGPCAPCPRRGAAAMPRPERRRRRPSAAGALPPSCSAYPRRKQVVFTSNATHAPEHCHPICSCRREGASPSPAMSTTPSRGRCTRWARGSRSPLRRSLTAPLLRAFEKTASRRSLTPSSARHVSNVFGFVLPIEEIAARSAARREFP